MTFNEMLWHLPNELGWGFWLPFVGYGIYGLNKIYRLEPADTALGRLIRVVLTVALTGLVFTPAFNGLGPWAFHLLAIGSCLILKQVYATCAAVGKIRPPESVTAVGRMVERMVHQQ